MPTLAETIEFVTRAHAGQTDKAGEPYYLHPLAVEGRVAVMAGATEDDRLVALLHDIIEDTTVTAAQLIAMGYSSRVVEVVSLLTKPARTDYAGYVAKLIETGDKTAMRVKLGDLLDNTDPERLARLPSNMANRLKAKYSGPIESLRAALGLDNASGPWT
jgi:(p)ppGpp synthase/HD superfamily hydrolase